MKKYRQYALYFGLLLPSMWIFLTLLASPTSSRQYARNERVLTEMQEYIYAFEKSFQSLPADLAELRAYIRTQGRRFAPYDPWGSRYQYEQLTSEWFFVKSFGSNTSENNFASYADPSYIHMEDLPRRPPIKLASSQSALNFYPGPLLLAAQSSSSPYVAELVINPNSQAKRLLIRNLLDDRFILPAFHDQVDEFFWLPSGYEMVFVASGSKRYEDGIYLWNLVNNSTRNILPDLKEQFPEIDRDQLYIALSSVDTASNRLFFFIKPMERAYLNPAAFYHTSNLYGAVLPPQAENDEPRYKRYDSAGFSIFQRQINPQGLLIDNFEGYPAQQDWLNLPNEGAVQVVLENWQNYCAKYRELPVLPYCLWWLSSLYHDTFHLLRQTKPNEAHVLRNFGVEMAGALDQLDSAPDYLRAMGLYLKKVLLENQAASYNVSQLLP